MVGGRIICRSRIYAGTHGRNHVDGEEWSGIHNQYIQETETEYKHIDRGRTYWGGRLYTTYSMDEVFLGSTGIWYQREHIL